MTDRRTGSSNITMGASKHVYEILWKVILKSKNTQLIHKMKERMFLLSKSYLFYMSHMLDDQSAIDITCRLKQELTTRYLKQLSVQETVITLYCSKIQQSMTYY